MCKASVGNPTRTADYSSPWGVATILSADLLRSGRGTDAGRRPCQRAVPAGSGIYKRSRAACSRGRYWDPPIPPARTTTGTEPRRRVTSSCAARSFTQLHAASRSFITSSCPAAVPTCCCRHLVRRHVPTVLPSSLALIGARSFRHALPPHGGGQGKGRGYGSQGGTAASAWCHA